MVSFHFRTSSCVDGVVATPRRRDAVDSGSSGLLRRYRSTQAPTNGTCACDEGFEWDPDYGSCGRPQFNTSAWTGLQRCPGYVTKDTALDPVDVLNLRYVYIADASNSTADEILAAKRKAGANISSLSVPGGMYTNGADSASFLAFSEVEGRVDGVGAVSRHRDAVAVAA